MPGLNHSSLSTVCRAVVDYLKANVAVGDSSVNVSLGNPAHALPAESSTAHGMNVFFYRFEPSAFQSDLRPGDTWLMRCYCLITPFAVDEDNKSAGENDVKLVGEVLRLFHEAPVQTVTVEDAGESLSFHLQIVHQPLNLETVNQLWGTQGDVVYRPSLAYELNVAPVLPIEKTIESPMVGNINTNTRADMRARQQTVSDVPVPYLSRAQQVPTQVESWAPALCWVHNQQCVESIALALNSTELQQFSRRVLVAGAINAEVQLYWEVWHQNSGWHVLDAESQRQDVMVTTDAILPNDINMAHTFIANEPSYTEQTEDGPVAVNPLERVGQCVLYARRTYRRAADGNNGPVYTARSNPLLISIYEESP